MANLEKKEQKRIAFHEKNIESSKQKIFKYEQKMDKPGLSDKKKDKLQQKIRQEVHFIEMQEHFIEDADFIAQPE